MSKYDPIERFLNAQPGDRIPVRFSDLEAVLGFNLPASKRYPAWWSNSPANNPMTRTWLRAGYMTEQVDTTSERLVFRRSRPGGPVSGASAQRSGPFPGSGAMKGTLRVADGVDLSAPADPNWSEVFK